mmetsp:Transcript_177530/g.569363  ORF Transcript_177530/g.569363 Transcript_177530/m.569363 type:complete len:266 (+) Transcript_177530:273-1070(+)
MLVGILRHRHSRRAGDQSELLWKDLTDKARTCRRVGLRPEVKRDHPRTTWCAHEHRQRRVPGIEAYLADLSDARAHGLPAEPPSLRQRSVALHPHIAVDLRLQTGHHEPIERHVACTYGQLLSGHRGRQVAQVARQLPPPLRGAALEVAPVAHAEEASLGRDRQLQQRQLRQRLECPQVAQTNWPVGRVTDAHRSTQEAERRPSASLLQAPPSSSASILLQGVQKSRQSRVRAGAFAAAIVVRKTVSIPRAATVGSWAKQLQGKD